MKPLFVMLWLAFVGFCSYKNSQCCINSSSKASNTTSYSDTFTISNGDFSLQCQQGRFLKSQSQLLNTQIANTCFDQLKQYQSDNPNQNWLITGHYNADETNNTIYTNLGEARAQQIKNILVNQSGFNASDLKIAGKLVAPTAFNMDTLQMGYTIRASQDNINQTYVSKFDNTKPILLRFDTASSVPKLDAEIRAQFANLLADLNANPSNKILVTGHTDSQGDADKNEELGAERALSVKQYLVSNGLNVNRIDTQSKGEREPISDNDTLNRRVEVTLIQPL